MLCSVRDIYGFWIGGEGTLEQGQKLGEGRVHYGLCKCRRPTSFHQQMKAIDHKNGECPALEVADTFWNVRAQDFTWKSKSVTRGKVEINVNANANHPCCSEQDGDGKCTEEGTISYAKSPTSSPRYGLSDDPLDTVSTQKTHEQAKVQELKDRLQALIGDHHAKKAVKAKKLKELIRQLQDTIDQHRATQQELADEDAPEDPEDEWDSDWRAKMDRKWAEEQMAQ